MTDAAVAELRFHTTHDAADILAYWLHEAGALGVTIVDPEEIREDLLRPDSLDYAGRDFLDALPDHVVLTAWFYRDGDNLLLQKGETRQGAAYPAYVPDKRAAGDFIADLEAKLLPLHEGHENGAGALGFVSIKTVRPEDWADQWKQYAVPIRIGRRFLIVPSWQDDRSMVQAGDIVLMLDPGMAFGSGSHETTAQCLALLESTVQPGDAVLDLGTGSGLLAMAAKKLGAARVLALDVDPVAVQTAAANAAQNDVPIETRTGSVDAADGPFNVIAANIVFDVLVALKDGLYSRLAPGGRLIASGVLEARGDAFIAALETAGFCLIHRQSERDWAAFVFGKTS